MTATKPSDETVKLGAPGAVRESLGEWCVRRGLATAEEIDSCLKIQRAAEVSGQSSPRLGEILVARGILTPHQVSEALAAQQKEIRSCPRCGIQINVSMRGDAALYRCGRCNGPLAAPAGSAPLHAVEEDFILVSRDPLPPEVEAAVQDPAARFGKYVLLRQLGQGGIGIVYLAWDTYLSQYVALKRLRTARPLSPQDTPNEHVQSLLKEARNSIRLRHPGVVSVFDVGRIGREYYVAMEYLEGETLGERIYASRQRGEPSPYFENPRESLTWLAEIARAVHYAHTRPSPIVHCDLKPANILIDRESRAHVLDFGLARNLILDKPEEGEISGTPSYMAPEQASGESDKIDARTDVYAFGAILYEMLTGRPPFVGGTIEILGQTIGDEPGRPSDTLRSTQEESRKDPSTHALLAVPPALEDLCMKCLKKDRRDRPQTMDEVALALERCYRSGKPKTDPSSPAPLSSLGSPERSRRPLLMATLVAMTAGILLGGSALVLSLSRPAAEGAAFEIRESEIHQAIARFHPGAARAQAARLRDESRGGSLEARASRLLEEATWVTRLQSRVADRLAVRPVTLSQLRTRDGRTLAARLVGADLAGLRILGDGGTQTLRWESLETATLIEVIQSSLGEPEDADLLGLGIFALRAGLVRDAERCFGRLRNTSFGPIAEHYQTSSNN